MTAQSQPAVAPIAPVDIPSSLRQDFAMLSNFLFKSRLRRKGVALYRSFLPRDAAVRIGERFARNVERTALYPDLLTNSARTVFSPAMAFADPNDETLRSRLLEAIESKKFFDPSFILPSEHARFMEEVGSKLIDLLSFLGPIGPTPIAFARFEKARPNSAYDFHAVHQDARPDITPDPTAWTAWLTFSPCGWDAPSLQYVERRFSDLLPEQRGERLFLSADDVKRYRFRRPILQPGDLVVFSAYTLHGTWITRGMTRARYSLDVRMAAAP